jgi:monoamine oxidase
VGGGPGGLFTAFLLERATAQPLRITLFEATDRLGGKVLSPRFAAAPIRYEAGAAEFYDYSPVGDDPLRNLVAELGLQTVPLGGSAVVIDGATLGNLDDVGRRLGTTARRAVEAFDQRARAAMTPREFYAADEAGAGPARSFSSSCELIGDPAARRYIESLIHSDLATEPESTSVSYGLQNYLMNDPAYMGLYCIGGGNEQLIDAIVARLATDMRLGCHVDEVAAADAGRLCLTTREAAAGTVRCEEFDAVVLALPIQHLAGVRVASERLAGAMRSHLAQFSHPAHYLRVTILFDEPFWRGRFDGGYAMLDAFGGSCLYDESARYPEPRLGVLGWLLGGSAAADWADADDEALVAAALHSLPASFGEPRPHLLEARVHRWINAVSALPGGWRPPNLDRRHQPDPVGHPNLFVVGDYLFDSTLNGVLDSATHVAGWLASRFG